MKTGEIIKDLRVKKGLTQEELTDKTELSAPNRDGLINCLPASPVNETTCKYEQL